MLWPIIRHFSARMLGGQLPHWEGSVSPPPSALTYMVLIWPLTWICHAGYSAKHKFLLTRNVARYQSYLMDFCFWSNKLMCREAKMKLGCAKKELIYRVHVLLSQIIGFTALFGSWVMTHSNLLFYWIERYHKIVIPDKLIQWLTDHTGWWRISDLVLEHCRLGIISSTQEGAIWSEGL